MKKVLSYANKKLIDMPCECPHLDCSANKCRHPDNLEMMWVSRCTVSKFPVGCPLDTYLTMDEINRMREDMK